MSSKFASEKLYQVSNKYTDFKISVKGHVLFYLQVWENVYYLLLIESQLRQLQQLFYWSSSMDIQKYPWLREMHHLNILKCRNLLSLIFISITLEYFYIKMPARSPAL